MRTSMSPLVVRIQVPSGRLNVRPSSVVALRRRFTIPILMPIFSATAMGEPGRDSNKPALTDADIANDFQ